MRSPFLGPSFIFGLVLYFWTPPLFPDLPSIFGPVLYFWTRPLFLDLSSIFETRLIVPSSGISTSTIRTSGLSEGRRPKGTRGCKIGLIV